MNYNTEKEVWKDVKGYEGLYEVSNHGRVKSLARLVEYVDGRSYVKDEKILSTPPNTDGYPVTLLIKNKRKKSHRVHRLVAKAFVENPNSYDEVNHIDEIKDNNHVSNLEWCSRVHNMNHGTAMERAHSHPNAIKRLEESKHPVIGVHIKTEKEIRFESINEADRNGYPRRNVDAVIRGNDKTCKDHIWFYEEEYTSELKDEKMKPFRIRVKQLDDDGNVLNEFIDAQEAGKFVGVHPSNISRAITQGRKSKGFNWVRE